MIIELQSSKNWNEKWTNLYFFFDKWKDTIWDAGFFQMETLWYLGRLGSSDLDWCVKR